MNISDPYNLVKAKFDQWLSTFIEMLPNLLVATLTIILFIILARLIRKYVNKLLDRVSSSAAVNRLISTLLYLTTLIIGIFVTLGILQLDKTVTSLLAGAGIIGLALSFAFQDLATNFVSGVLIAIRKPFDVGDTIETNDHFGTVHKINLRTTDLLTFQGQIVLIPNKLVFENPIINYNKIGYRRIDLAVGVSYGDDLEKVRKTTLDAVGSIPSIDKSKTIDLYYEEFGNSSINFIIRFWIKFSNQTEFLKARSESIMRIKRAYDENDITIPFPIRTLDFGIKGGEKLSSMINQFPGNGTESEKTEN